MRVSRRGFIGTITGGSALTLLGLDRRALADFTPGGNLVTDYVGRLCFNENPLGPPQAAIDAIVNEAPMAHRYTDWYAESLISALASHYDLPGDTIIPGVGATEIIRMCAKAFCASGTNVVVPTPSYGQFESDAQIFGSTVRYVALDSDHRVDLAGILGRVDSHTAAICITNPNNPTATALDYNAVSDFIHDLPSGVTTVIDEAYIDYMPNFRSAVELVGSGHSVVVIKTFSKVYGLAGARIGYAIGRYDLINQVSANRLTAMISRPSLEAAKAALGAGQHVADTVELADQTKAYCFGEFDRMGLPYIPSDTSFFMVDVGDAEYVRAALAAREIYVRTGWGMNNHLRVSTGTMEEMIDFITVLEEILNPLKSGGELPKPTMTELFQAYPNPFNASTQIRIYIPKMANARLEIFDVQGRSVKILVDSILGAGEYAFVWNGTNSAGRPVASGTYYYRLKSGDDVITRRMLLLK